MDPLIYLSCAAIIVIVLVLIGFLFKTRSNDRAVGDEAEQEGQVRGGVRRDPNVPVGARQRRARRRMAGAHRQQEEDDEEDDLMEDIALPEGKIGARKMRKLQDKAEKRKMREQEQIEREERKKREAELEKRRKQQELEQEKEEARLEAEEAKRKEEQAKREHEEYLKMKAQFVVEESGVTDLEHNLENESLLVQFIDYVKEMKVVMMEDLAAHFNIKTQECIDRIQTLQGDGTLTGVIDDRGKFIYITRDEMDDVAKFIRQRGRVSIAELAQSSNQLINLNPDNKHVAAKLLTTSS